MGSVLIIAAALAVTAYLASIRTGLVVLVASNLLIPSLIVLPGSPTTILTIQRLVTVALLANLLRRVHHREISGRIFAITPVHAVFLVFLAVAFTLGVGLAEPLLSIADTTHVWANFFDEFVFFLTALAAIRAIGDTSFVVRTLGALLFVTAVIAIIEHLTGASWSRLWFRATHQLESAASSNLQTRGGGARARVASGFSLAYAWLAVALVPFFVLGRVRRERRWWLVVPGVALVILGIYWTGARSAAAPLLVVMVALAVVARDRRVTAIGLGAAVVMIGAYVLSSTVATNLSTSIDQGSVDVRFQRIPSITSFVADHAWSGLGFTGVANLGFSAVDSAYLLIYGDIGIIGLTMLALLYVTAVVVVGRGLFAADPGQRTVAAACLFGVLTLIAAGLAYDAVTQLDDQRVLYLLVALGMVVAEQNVGAPRWLARPTATRLAAVGIAVGGGFLVAIAAPTHVAQTFTFSTLSPTSLATSAPTTTGRVLVHTVCNTATVGKFSRQQVTVTCRDPNEGRETPLSTVGPGQGELRISAPDTATLRAVLLSFTKTVRAEPRMRYFVPIPLTTAPVEGKPTIARTAPVWLPMLVGFAALMVPGPPRRRREEPPGALRTAPVPQPSLTSG